ncbi:4'-phosphopantetheinyl transferase superfamily protein [Viridibacillus sp. YIM B01967]|uniref:4'-phosphopantetheinyl transferase superfamily protein n=1 Tax=Viridibacillus soli TaxID=2798301 RepID=A0ABS1H5P9_9BACL|nr:4'-phosphopantetheinyl transferase superfamily protein [Viridibacillus soli]MBK3494734.1 4'-phosphopantetheinyl transferase superfamily protein [Viridibacillus soli]
MIELYAFRIPDQIDYHSYTDLLQLVSTEKQRKIERFYKPEDAYRTLFADLLVRHLLMDKYQVSNEDIKFFNNPYGKPYVHGFPKFSFNISHAGNWIVCAVDEIPLGIDIELIKPIDFTIAKNFFSEEENEDLRKIDASRKLEYFFELWTIKESYVKALGTGLSVNLNAFTVKKAGKDQIHIIRQDHLSPNLVKQYDIDPLYKCSLCSINPNFPEKPVLIEYKELEALLCKVDSVMKS